jgi:hypothetical protein
VSGYPPMPKTIPLPPSRPGQIFVHDARLDIVIDPDPVVACEYCGNVYAAIPAEGCTGCGARRWRPARRHYIGIGGLRPSDFVSLKR